VKSYTFAWEVQTLLEQFSSALNDIIVKKYDNIKTSVPPTSGNLVRFVYAPKQKVISSLTTPGPGGVVVPVVSISVSGLSRDNTRVFNKNDGFFISYNTQENNGDLLKKILQPVPINIAVNMSIITKYQNDLDQIITNFVPYCDPYFVISWLLPLNSKSKEPYELRNEVLWNGNININYPLEMSGNQSFQITADTSFTIKGWLFKKMDDPIKKIYTIQSDFSTYDGKNTEFSDIENVCVLKDLQQLIEESKL